MSVAYYIVLEREIEGFDPFVNGKALGHCDEQALMKLCKKLGVKPLMEFSSQDPEEIADLMEDAGVDVPDKLPATQWFEAADGLVTVRALAAHLAAEPKALKNGKAIAEDFGEYVGVLERGEKEGVRWYLALDY